MMGTMFCQYETPCGWCTRLNKECTAKGGCVKPGPKKMKAAAVAEPEEKLLSPVGEYAAKFAENHGMSINDAMEHPMVKAFAEAQEGLKLGLMRGGV